jgi:pimeloyl-ACP methyl ester carboxylesterase
MQLAALPTIGVPSIALQGEADDVVTQDALSGQDRKFAGRFERRVLARVGHNPPREAPRDFAAAILELIGAT